MTFDLLQQTVALNNQAVQLFQSGNFLDAICFMQQGIATLKEVPLVYKELRLPGTPATSSSAIPTPQKDYPLEGYSHASFVKATDLLHPQFRLIEIQNSFSNSMETTTKDLLSSVMFNLAVACHCVGTTSGSSATLLQARDIYFVVLNSQQQLHFTTMDQQNHGALIQCLSLNNLAHIYYEVCDYDYSRQLLDCMMEVHDRTDCLSSSCSNIDVDSCRSLFLSEWESEEIRLNFLYAIQPSAAGSA